MKEEVLDLWLSKKCGEGGGRGDDESGDAIRLVDGTVGMGGHTLAALAAVRAAGNGLCVLGIDRDAFALSKARKHVQAHVDDLEAGEGSEASGGAKEEGVRAVVEGLTAAAARSRENGVETSSEREEQDVAKAHCDVAFHHGSFADISPGLLAQHSLPSKVHGILIDCGPNSHQLDIAQRGFSFKRNGPLDMRFDATTPDHEPKVSTKVKDILNERSAEELAALFRANSDEPRAEEIASSIVEWRTALTEQRNSIQRRAKGAGMRTALELRFAVEDALEKVFPSKRIHNARTKFRKMLMTRSSKKLAKAFAVVKRYAEVKSRHARHVARVFRALRIEVNDELEHLRAVFERGAGARCLEAGGRLVVITYLPGEDEIVREGMAGMAATGEFRLVTPEGDGLRPAPEERMANGLAKTARLRAVERI